MNTLQQDDEDDHFLLDMDSIVNRDAKEELSTRTMYANSRKKCSLGNYSSKLLMRHTLMSICESRNNLSGWVVIFAGDDGVDLEDGNDWSSKPIKNWNQEDTINWLMSAASHMSQPYSSIQQSLAIPGKELVKMSRQKFLQCDPIYGDRLYDMLHSQNVSNLRKLINCNENF